MNTLPPELFSNKRRLHFRNRFAKNLDYHDFLLQIGASEIVNRLCEMKRPFDHALDLGCYHGVTSLLMCQSIQSVQQLTCCDISPTMIDILKKKKLPNTINQCIVADETHLPFSPHQFDVIVSNLNLHFINDLPGTLIQIQQCLKPNGLFIATLFGGQTLHELRQAFYQCEQSLYSRHTPRIAPFTDIKTMGMLMQRCGFEHIITDSDIHPIHYTSLDLLLQDIRYNCQSNPISSKNPALTKELLQAVVDFYKTNYSNADNTITATFEMIHVIGLKPQHQTMKSS